jgi:hypothetical protein
VISVFLPALVRIFTSMGKEALMAWKTPKDMGDTSVVCRAWVDWKWSLTVCWFHGLAIVG